MNIAINAEDVDRFVKEALLKSAIGDTVQKALNDLINGYNSPIKDAIKRHISNIAFDVLRERHSETIRAQIIEILDVQLTKELSDKVVNEAVTKMVTAMERSY